MSKPWDNEPTPATDAYAARLGNWSGLHDHCLATMRDKERRARHAEALLARWETLCECTGNGPILVDTQRHLSSAAQEDAR